MRTIERTGQFKRDFKRETKGSHRETLQREFADSAKILTAINKCTRSIAITRLPASGKIAATATLSPTWY